MKDINLYVKIFMTVIQGLHNECITKFSCVDCPFSNENRSCIFFHVPENYDLDKIKQAITYTIKKRQVLNNVKLR